MSVMIDLHVHSNASDGSYSPAELAAMCAGQGISVMALTDHDTTGGLDEGKIAAAKTGIGFIPGIELEITMPQAQSGEFHLLGLGIDKPTGAFSEAVAALSAAREERNREILKRMEGIGISVTYDELSAFAGGQSIGRPHFAALLVKRKIVKNIEQAFKRYLGKGRPLYLPKTGLNFDLAVTIIAESGGLSVLAHPMSLYVAWGRLPDLVKNLKERGLDGLEAWHPAAKVKECKRLEELGKSLDLFITAGSDFHGEARQDRKLGITAGNKKIGEKLLDAIPVLAEKYKPANYTG